MNVLFALYQNFACNSANHVDGIARELTALGCSCVVAVPSNPTQAELLGSVPYRIATFEQVLAGEIGFDNGQGIDVAHFWTPREVNRRFCERLQNRVEAKPFTVEAKPSTRRFATIIHMEDNEDLIARSQLRDSLDEYASGQRITGFPSHLAHPLHWRKFLASADGLTVIIDALRDIIPRDKPVELIWPSTDERNFHPRPIDPALRKELGIKPDHTLLAYHGNVHQANFREVRSLHLAVALLNREGWPTTLLRMGRDHIEVDPLFRRWAAEHTRTIGFVPDRARLAELLSQADLFVQPGLCDVFNQYRFPSKVPDFFALGRPVILPRTNIGLVTRHGEDAYVLDEANGPAIADAVKAILQDQELRRALSTGARRFFETNLRWPATAAKVLALYRRVLDRRPTVNLSQPTNGAASNLFNRYSRIKFPPLSYATVRDYCDSADNLKFLCTMNDLKDVQRPWTVKALIGQLKPGGTILEIGADEPLVASLLQSLGWKVVVCDPYDDSGHGTTEYRRYVKAYPNLRIIRSLFDQSIADVEGFASTVEGFASTPMRGQLDAVYSISVLEHVPAADLERAFAGIDAALKPGGLSLHCADAVVQGNGAEFHLEQMARIQQFQNRLAGADADWDRCLRSIQDLFAAAMQDLDTFFLGPQGHNQWRGSQPSEKFPFRKCISVQFLARKPG